VTGRAAVALLVLAAPAAPALAVADLSLTMSAGATTVHAGSTVTFNISLQNNGPTSATNPGFSDTLPAGTVFSAITKPTGWTCQTPSVGATGTVVCAEPSEPAGGGSNAFKITVKVLSSTAGGTRITNSATASSSTSDPSPGNNTDSVTVNVDTLADVSVTISDSPDPVLNGETVLYTMVVTNHGPSDAAGLVLDMPAPPSTTGVSGSCQNSSGTSITTSSFHCPFNATGRAAGASSTASFKVRPNVANPSVLITGIASLSLTTTDPDTSDNTASAGTTVLPAADLRMSVIDTPDPATAGGSVIYNATAINDGPNTAAALTIVLSPSAGLGTGSITAISAGATCTQPGGTFQCTWSSGTIVGQPRTVQATFPVKPETTTTQSLTATVSSSTDPDTSNNSDTEATAISTSANLKVTQSAPSSTVAGTPTSYTVTLENLGPSSAAGVTLTESLPSSFGSPSISKPAGWTCSGSLPTITCTVSGPLAPTSSPLVFRFDGSLSPSEVAGLPLTATASVTASTTDPATSNNSASTTVSATASADVSVTVTDSPDPLAAGQRQSYSVSVRNAGPSFARSLTVTIPTGAGRKATGFSQSGDWTCNFTFGVEGSMTCTTSVLALTTKSLGFTVQADPAFSPCSCSHSVTVSASTADPDASNNTFLVTTSIVKAYDLALTLADSPDPLTAGRTITYTVTATNLGPSTSDAGAEITDTLAPGLQFFDFTPSASCTCTVPAPLAAGPLSCRFLNPIAPLQSQSIRIYAITTESLAGQDVPNSATLAHGGNDTDAGNESASTTTHVSTPTVAQADVSLGAAAAPDPVTAGANLTYTLRARNTGPDPAENVTVSDSLPIGTKFLSASGGTCTTPAVGARGNLRCVFAGSTAPGVVRTVTLVVSVDAGFPPGTLSNTASAGSDTSDPDGGNNADTVATEVVAAAPESADLRITKSAAPDPGLPLSLITYAIGVVNAAGGAAAADVRLTDTLPAGTTFTSLAAPNGWSCTTPAPGSAGTLSCSKGSMAAGERADFALVARVAADASGTLVNTARVATATPESSTANNTDSASVTVPGACPTAPPRLLVPIVLDVDTGSARFTTELALTNKGSTDAALTLTYTPALGDRLGAGSVHDTLAAGRQLVLPDVLAYLRANGLAVPTGGQQGGTLMVTFQGAAGLSDVAATARTTALTAAPQPIGAAGLAYAGVDPCAGVKGRAVLFGLRSTDADRSNVAVFNPTGEAVTFRVTVLSGSGDGARAVIRENDSLGPLGWTQYSRILDGTGIANGICVLETTSATGALGAYLVINDNLTNDGSFALPVTGAASGDALTLPVLVETPTFRSELVLGNLGAAAATLQVSYVESLSRELGPGGIVTFTLAAGEQRILPDAVELLRSMGAAIGPRGSASYAGALRVRVSGVPASDVFVGARTASLSPAGGQFGLFTPGVYGGAEAQEQAFVFGLQSGATTRANVAVLNAGDSAAGSVTLELTAFDGDAAGAARGSETLTLSQGAWTQRNGFLKDHGVANGWVRVRRVAGSAPWIAYGVVNDGANPGDRTGDGAFVPMVR